jgi:Ca2+-binding EF-hand superfamily protein
MKSPAQTPSKATPNTRLRQPIDSPFPSSPLFHSSPPLESERSHSLSQRQIAEIQTAFRLFDPNLNGYIDPPSFEVMARSLGFRMSKVQILGMVESAWEERLQQNVHGVNEQSEEATTEERRRIDLSTAIYILSKKGYSNRNASDEMYMYFRIFDRDNKGCITLEDLTRAHSEIVQTEKELRQEFGELDVLDSYWNVNEETLKLMIEEFDGDGDGVIDFEEFKRVVQPLLSGDR